MDASLSFRGGRREFVRRRKIDDGLVFFFIKKIF
jgi:hypothetical protein